MNTAKNRYTGKQISVIVPLGWTTEEGEGSSIVSFSNAQSGGSITVSKAIGISDLDKYLETTKQSLSRTQPNFKLLSYGEITLDSGYKAKTFTCSFDLEEMTFIGFGMATIFGSNAYSVIGVVRDTKWKDKEAEILECANSLMFLG